MRSKSTKSIEVFFSCAYQDKQLRNKLEKHLAPLEHQGLITIWHVHKSMPGVEQSREVNTHLNTARIILLLVSPDFMASDYCYNIEMKRALERHTNGETTVIPIILRPVDWKNTP